MELDLQAARVAREVEELVKIALSRLPLVAQKDVLQRVALDVVTAIEADQAKARSGGRAGRRAAGAGRSPRAACGPGARAGPVAAGGG